MTRFILIAIMLLMFCSCGAKYRVIASYQHEVRLNESNSLGSLLLPIIVLQRIDDGALGEVKIIISECVYDLSMGYDVLRCTSGIWEGVAE